MLNLTKRSGLMWSILLSTTVLTGCSDRIGKAEQQMAEIRNAPAQPIKPPPPIEKVEDFVYSANTLRSPFVPPSLVNVQPSTVTNNGVRPDLTREKEPLEQIELSELIFRGLVISPEGEQYGLVQRPDGSIASVKVGDYLGVNDGRIVEITPTQINLIEIVPDSRSGFIEKPASLVSPAS
ncbi:MAG: pilus assembly protein PilP [Psychrobacter sp.]|nr:pilus assembly protein PilP [Psychrobacter sp.]